MFCLTEFDRTRGDKNQIFRTLEISKDILHSRFWDENEPCTKCTDRNFLISRLLHM